ncbi:RNA polymerase III Rpc4 [Metarhizium album ARSEF 1941]|uniref:RNA polymerase III Rpc4 n=1 Tax=Metarhizium album (strain ARSEF 1941) TaxID=1081103 RepID=A0A0B2WFA0_METAS|nr:RNA polymerase III Rpc4 [Metarhizium album ARSEF 1941]KHN94596.1 RNA polymerase III Rpc4 [Metarhizium album ARSEF 1941]
MVRGRATGRGVRRGSATSAAAGRRAPADGSETLDGGGTSNEATTATPATLDEAAASSSSTTGVSTRRGGTAAGARTTTGGRLKPKILRRDEADRDKLARQEEQKAHERAAAERRARGRSRNRSKRSRGDAMGARGGRGTSTASGPFSGGFAGAGGSAAGGWAGRGSGAAAGGAVFGGRGKSESKGKGFAEADVRMREARINADKLHVMTPEEELDSDDEAMMAALSRRTAITMPMGIYRREHKEQGVVVATTAELEAAENATGEEESLWVDGEGPGNLPPMDQPEEGVWNTNGKQVSIKEEPGSEDPMDLDAVAKVASAEEEKKVILATKPKRELPKDPEERAIQADLDLLAGELGAVTVTDEAGETQAEGPSNKDGRLYLFQFPPLIPPLKEVAQPRRKTKVKAEGKEFNVTDAPSATAVAVDLTQDDYSNRNSDDDDDDDDEDEEEQANEGFRSQLPSHGGMVGKLNVRKSGKVELDWGGTTLEMSPAAGMSFLTTAVIVEENDEKPQQGVLGGDSVGMGKIMGRFVLAPTWSEEEDWNVAPRELLAG